MQALRNVIASPRYILDLGCGTGRVARVVAPTAARYLGIDLSPHMVREARRNVPEAQFIQGDFFDIAPVGGEYDTVLLMHNTMSAIHPGSRRRELFGRIAGWLPRGGLLIFSTHVPSHNVPGNPDILLRLNAWHRRMAAAFRGYGYVPEDYHGYKVWQYRATPMAVAEQLSEFGLDVLECHLDWSRRPFDWIYYVAVRR
ncbi:class I SAM-dependent methyltransferase [Micromonospora saelicesensis]|uniref:class I SAM-dependent methyltransferase n=1 Tax=Micromonospora saelicesensis TaxID=285676 RepID=UPI000DD99352